MSLNDNIKEVVVYKKNQIKKINNNNYNIDECFNNVPNQFELLITNAELDKIKKDESGVEFIFRKDIQYTIKPVNKTKTFKKAFIPLSGRYKKMLFLGHDDGYGSFTPYGLVNCDLINNAIEKQ